VNLRVARSLPVRPVTAVWYRAVPPQHWPTALSTAHTLTQPGRYNAASHPRAAFQIMYLSENPQVALREIGALFGSPRPGAAVVSNPTTFCTIVSVEVTLSRVVDLTDPAVVGALGTSFQELSGDWVGYTLRSPAGPVRSPYWTDVPTQRLGHALFRARSVEGFIAYSAKDPTRRNFMVYPDRLRTGSFLRAADPQSGTILTVP
jgi:RES domain-containing protein